MKFKIDTGVEVTAISTETFKQLNGCTLNKSGKRLNGPSRQPLQVVGNFQGSLKHTPSFLSNGWPSSGIFHPEWSNVYRSPFQTST